MPRAAPSRSKRLPLSSALVLLALTPARAEPLLARYEVRAAGLRVMEVEAAFDVDGPRYRVRTRVRLVGAALTFGGGEQVTQAEGTWRDLDAVPRAYRVNGSWRGSPRLVVMDWGPDATPVVAALQPPQEPDREPVPPAVRRGTLDSLSALARLLRVVTQTGRCDAVAPVFDGRRRFDYAVRTGAIEPLPPSPAFRGSALRCDVEYRLVAGLRDDQDRLEATRPQLATVWLARLPAVGTPVPVRLEVPTGWLGTVRLLLLSLEPGVAEPPG